MRPFAIFVLLAFVGQASAGPNAEMGGSMSTAVISSTRFPGDFDWDFDVDFADFWPLSRSLARRPQTPVTIPVWIWTEAAPLTLPIL